MTKLSNPKFEVFDIEKMLITSEDNVVFWVNCVENRILSISEEYLKSKLNFDKQIDRVKFLKKLRSTEKSNLKNVLPKYIVVQSMSHIRFDWSIVNTYSDEARIIEIFDIVAGKNNVHIRRPDNRMEIIQLEVWINDDDDLASLEFYQLSHPELFYY